jgi:elongation factor 2
MVNFTVEQMRRVMDDPKFIRNICICAHVDAGKSTTTDSLLAKCGILNKRDAGDKCATDTMKEEQERGITIKSTGVSMYFNYGESDSSGESKLDADELSKFVGEYLINLIDSPGHVDFSSEVTAALRVTDGAVVLTDCIDGVCVQTETVLRQALQEKIKPVLMINKLDRLFLELHKDTTEAYQRMRNIIEDVNVLLATYENKDLGELSVNPVDDTVLFGSGYHQWGFTLRTFAEIYAPIFKKSIKETKEMIWNKFYYADTKKWSNKPMSDGKKGVPGFVQLIMNPIRDMCDAIMNKDEKTYTKMFKRLKIKVTDDELALIHTKPKKLCKAAMSNWLPLSNALLGMVIEKLPSPQDAQRYRSKDLYTGPEDDVLTAMQNCDPKGPLMMYISKIIPLKEEDTRFHAFGRVFSGTLKAGTKLKIMDSNYEFGEKRGLKWAPAQQVVTLMAGKSEKMNDIPCGNTCALVGIDKYLGKTGTISDVEEAYPIKDMKFSVHPVVNVAVSVGNSRDQQKLVDALKKLQSTDTRAQISFEETGDIVVAGVGELHLEICINYIKQHLKGIDLKISDPVVSYRETVIMESEAPNLSKSPNNHNRLYAVVKPLPDGLVTDIENDVVTNRPLDEKEQARYIAETYEEDPELYTKKKLWAFGPTDKEPNLLMNSTTGTQYMSEIKDSCKNGFVWATRAGPLCDEPVRGVSVRIMDAVLHADAIHRGMGQVLPAMRRVILGSMLKAQPRLMEPMFLLTVSIIQGEDGPVYGVISTRRGKIVEVLTEEGSPMCTIKAHIPVDESKGLDAALRGATGGKAFSQCSFSHYELIDSDPLEEGSFANEIVKKTRERKGLGPMKPAEYYIDKL